MIDKEVLVFSASRTGSTFIWQCLCKIFTKVHKHHDGQGSHLFQKKLPCIITERNRVESFVSRMRVLRAKDESNQVFLDKLCNSLYALLDNGVLQKDVDDYYLELHTVEYLKVAYSGKLLALKYEDFFNNYDFIFDQFERFFEISIETSVKDSIMYDTNLSANEKRQEKFQDFDTHCEDSLIHGKHILSGEPNFYKNHIDPEMYNRLHNMLWEKNEDWKKLYNYEG